MNPNRLANISNFDYEEARLTTLKWRDEYAKLMHNLGRRALRSFHVEVLSHLFTSNRYRSDGLWARLNVLQKHLNNPATVDDISAIRRFCQAANLRSQVEALAFSECLHIATGGVPHWNIVSSRATVLSRLVQLSTSFVPVDGAMHPSLLRTQFENLLSIFKS